MFYLNVLKTMYTYTRNSTYIYTHTNTCMSHCCIAHMHIPTYALTPIPTHTHTNIYGICSSPFKVKIAALYTFTNTNTHTYICSNVRDLIACRELFPS